MILGEIEEFLVETVNFMNNLDVIKVIASQPNVKGGLVL